MSLAALGRRVGAFVLFADGDGLRHAIRLHGVLALSDADDLHETTMIVMPGGRVVMIREPFDEVLEWFS